MLPEKITRLFVVGIVCLTAAGCSLFSGGSQSLSRKEKAEINLQMGVRYMDLGKMRTAKEKLELAYDLDSSNSDINNALGVLHERLQQYDEAGHYYREAMELSPDDPSVKNNLGRFLCDRGNFGEGLSLLNQSAQMPLNSRKWMAYTNIGLCHQKQNKLDDAEQSFRQALQYNPNYPPALVEMQSISYEQRNYMSARAFLQRYLSVAKHTPQTLWIAYQTERATGNREAAEKNKQDLLTLFPGSEQARQVRTTVNR